MSKIGEYIHFHASRYNKYGTGRDEKSASSVDINRFHRQLESYISKNINKASSFSEQDKKELADGIMAFMKPIPAESADMTAAYSLLHEKIEGKLENKLKNAVIDATKMTINVDNPEELTRGMGQAKKYSKGFDSYMYYTSTLNKIDSLLQNFAADLKKHKKYSAVKELKKKFLNLKQDVITKANYKTGNDIKIPIVRSSDTQSLAEVYEELNKYIQLVAALPDVSNIEGVTFERAIGLALNCAINYTKEEMNEILEKTVIGDKNQSKIQRYNINKFSSIINEQLGRDTFLNITSNLKNKVDIIFEWKGQNKGISAKNYTFTDDFNKFITVVNGSSLMYMIQDLNTDFINHFLNAIASHQDGKTIENNEDIRKTMKQFLFYKGLTGDTYGRSKSDIPELMIINNKKTGRVQVLDVQDLYKKINNNIGMLSVKIGGVNIMTARVYNEYVTTSDEGGPSWHLAEVRIANYLLRVHAAKVSAGFNIQTLK